MSLQTVLKAIVQSLIGRVRTKAETNSVFGAVFREPFGRFDFKMDGVTKAMFLNLHNEVRRLIARGKYFGVDEPLGPAKNMYMLRWDYNLERIAEESINSCSTTEPTFEATHYARNVDVTKSVGLLDWYLLNAYTTVLKWKNEAREHRLSANNSVGHSGLFEFANMVYSKTTKVGCSVKWCESFYITACAYDKHGNRLGTSLWETSTSECIWDGDCTTYNGSTCDGGLCVDSKSSAVVELIQPTINRTEDVSETTTSDSIPWDVSETTQSTISFSEDDSEITQPTTSFPADISETTSPSTSFPEKSETTQLITDKCSLGNGMTDEARNAILNEHNRLRSTVCDVLEKLPNAVFKSVKDKTFLVTCRSLVAKGLAEDPKGVNGYAPKAARMLKLVYDCKIEESASRHAQKCVFESSAISERPGLGENLFHVSGMRTNFSVIGVWASQSWFSQLKEGGVQPDNLFTWMVANQSFSVSQYSQMVWDRTYKLGCGAAICSEGSVVICQYGPGGNFLDEEIYTVGEPCKTDGDCGCDGCTCSRDEALCVKPENETLPLVLTFPPLLPFHFQLPPSAPSF
ncbi:unnamed protein product [Angiostrongylus costaricensis]|uniref:SCP domain-containing protein n=1 Tax=Angiostrongylus costaricensis TaxID=334426 RepID=A0A0R3PKE1_ANGCS|nr:unnamed protein product [Angiostrongylus costaricensis]